VTFLLVSFVGYLLLARADSLAALVAACVLIGAGFGGTSGPLMALLADLTPTDRMGRATGTNNVLGDLGGALGPMVTLPLIDVVGFGPLYVACAVVPLLAGAVMVAGIYTETGSVNPETEWQPGDLSPDSSPEFGERTTERTGPRGGGPHGSAGGRPAARRRPRANGRSSGGELP
jgi:MFS family permease